MNREQCNSIEAQTHTNLANLHEQYSDGQDMIKIKKFLAVEKINIRDG